jgi:hypothetical protein
MDTDFPSHFHNKERTVQDMGTNGRRRGLWRFLRQSLKQADISLHVTIKTSRHIYAVIGQYRRGEERREERAWRNRLKE